MNVSTATASSGPDRSQRASSMRAPLIASLMFHGFLILLFSGAFFFFSKPVTNLDEPMAVEILPITEKAQSNIEAPVAKKVKEPEEVKDEPPPMPKAVEQKQAPKADTPKPTEKVEAEKFEEIRPTEAPKPIKKAEIAEKKAAPPKPVKQPEKKPVEAKKEEVKKQEEPKEDTEEFSSVLKNLVGEEDAPPMPDSVPRDTPRQAPQLTAPAPLGAQLSMSEMDALRAQLAQCWNVIAGARDAQDLVVDIDVTVSPERTVLDARVSDRLRYSSDTLFRAAADSAMRALRAPACTPLNLPPQKYDQWKSMTISFDPKNMF